MYPEAIEKHLGYIDIIIGIGEAIGPTVSGILIGYLQYMITMVSIGASGIVAFFITVLFIPSAYNQKVTHDMIKELDNIEK